MRENPVFTKHAKMQDMLHDYENLASKAERAIYIPGPGSQPEELDAFLSKMGIPKGPEGYELADDAVKDIPGGKELLEEWRKTAHQAGMTKKQAVKAFDFVSGLATRGIEAQKKAEKEAKEGFDARLAEAAGSKEKGQEAKNRMIAFMSTRVRDPELIKDMAARGILYDHRYALLFADLQRQAGDAPFVAGHGNAQGPAKKGSQGSYHPEFEATYGGKR
jgi:hypothetical protein